MTKFNYLFPSWGALISVLTVLVAYFCLWRKLEKSKRLIIKSFSQRFETPQAQTKIQEVMDEKLDELIVNLRNQIPMGSMLLTSALSGKVKEIAKEGILKMMPDLKERLISVLVSEMRLENTLWPILKSELCRIVIYSALLGFILGFIWMWLEQG